MHVCSTQLCERVRLPEVIFPGPEGRLQGRYQPSGRPRPQLGIVLHPHPGAGGTMNNAITLALYKMFVARGFATLRFNYRGVGRSEGEFDNGVGELSDAAAALDWLQSINPESSGTWVAGFSFGALIGMQLLMRRPEVRGFVSISPPANLYDFGFLAPCPSSGLIVHGMEDEVVDGEDVQKLVDKLKLQKHITIDYEKIDGANHFYADEMPELMGTVEKYIDRRLASGD